MLTITRGAAKVNVITDPKEARKLIASLAARKESGVYALDFETTSLRPELGQVRITSISAKDDVAYVLDHWKCGSFASYADDLMELQFHVFNVKFEGRWFQYEVEDGDVGRLDKKLLDVSFMRCSVMGGGAWKLQTMAKRDLDIELDKEDQKSDWGADKLTNKQYFYAGYDSIVTRKLAVKWRGEMTQRHWDGFWTINETWRAVNEAEDTGLHIDVDYHWTLIHMWEKRVAASKAAIRRLIGDKVKNINSKKQISDFIKSILDEGSIADWPKTEKTEQLQTDRNTLRAMSYIAPYPFSRFLAALMVYNKAMKYVGTYGETLVTIQRLSDDNLIRSRLNMAAAITGRFSSSGPNQQNFPNAYAFRYSFKSPPGTRTCIADYSGVEIRVLAEVSGDKILLHDAIYDDVHTRSAIAIFKIKDVDGFIERIKRKEPKAKSMRTRAKAFTFQLLYGAGAAALAIALRCSVSEAEDAIDAWAARYSRAYAYRRTMFEKMTYDGFLPTASGRTIFVNKRDRSMPVAANYPIQGSAADVMYRAMFHVQRLLEIRMLDARLAASVHDEVLVRTTEEHAEFAKEALEEGMKLGWLDIFPGSNTDNLMEAVVADRWSEKA